MTWNTTWKGGYDETLIASHNDKLSAAKIAEAVNGKHGTSFTRNAVIGRIHRLGLNRDKPKPVASKVAPIRTKERLAVGVGAQVQAIRRKRKVSPPAPIEEVFTPRTVDLPSHRKTILDLKAMECRWPDEDRNDDGLHTFCGCRTADASSYCPTHAELSKGQGTASERNALGLVRRAAA
jgi:GcrA cell cycle regulator